MKHSRLPAAFRPTRPPNSSMEFSMRSKGIWTATHLRPKQPAPRKSSLMKATTRFDQVWSSENAPRIRCNPEELVGKKPGSEMFIVNSPIKKYFFTCKQFSAYSTFSEDPEEGCGPPN